MGISQYNEYSLEVRLTGFGVEVTSRRPATSAAEFLTDVFEYAGLFTGICAYSALVAPASMYLEDHLKDVIISLVELIGLHLGILNMIKIICVACGQVPVRQTSLIS